MSSNQPQVRLVVAIPTFRRPERLGTLLPRVIEHVGALGGSRPSVRGSVLVIDNDPDGSAFNTVSDAAAHAGAVKVRYVNEPEPGIAAARDTAMTYAEDEDLLVFVDDDETPTDTWLEPLVDAWRATEPAGVIGLVVPEFEVSPEPWIVAGGFFERRRHPDGTTVPAAATNNLLLDLRQVGESGVRFDRALGLSGGEDTLFTFSLTRRGYRIVACPTSVVVDRVTPDRATRRWVLIRRYAHGIVQSRVALRLSATPATRLRARLVAGGKGIALVVAGVLRVLLGALSLSLSLRARGSADVVRGAGRLVGSLGAGFDEYTRKGDTGA